MLKIEPASPDYLDLSLQVRFYQDGIVRVNIDEIDGAERRYKITDEQDFVVVESHLTPESIDVSVAEGSLEITYASGVYSYNF